jgi:hypothetical protein
MRIRRGSTHPIVEDVQERLREAGFEPDEITGTLDESTVDVLAAFQEEHGLEVTGVIDEATLDALDIDSDLPARERERRQFRANLLQNPNYYGNLPDAPYDPEVEFSTDTSYEELTCVGYNPDLDRLDAVVHLKREFGYLGGLCSEGSTEYVRFWVDWDGSGSWSDAGMTSFEAHDIPGEKPLEYAVSVRLDPDREPCEEPRLPRVRAILSWNQPPPATLQNGDPARWDPIWGNVLDTHIQLPASDEVSLEEYLENFDIDPATGPFGNVDPDQLLSLSSTSVSSVDLLEQYAEVGVPGKRGGFRLIRSQLDEPMLELDPTNLQLAETFAEFDYDIGDLVAELEETESDTRYEELECVGLEGDDLLTATIRVKRPYGYGGDLCSDGSQEHVAFWEHDGGTWNHLGETSVSVHDIGDIPRDGLEYSASLPVDLSHHRQPCESGPSTVRIRAIMSWETPPPDSDPTFVPTWGNRMETLVQVPPGPAEPEEGKQTPYMDRVGNVQVCDIDRTTGLATGHSTVANFTATQSPFGGQVYVSGLITNPPNTVGGGATPLEYRVRVRPLDPGTNPIGPWQPVTNPFTVGILEKLGPTQIPQQRKERRTPDPDGWLEYLEDLSGSAWRRVDNRLLAVWDSGNQSGKWEIQLQAMISGSIVSADPISCPGGGTRQSVVVQLDNDRSEPAAEIDITNGKSMTPPGQTTAVVCKQFDVGEVVQGTFTGTDEYFRGLRLSVDPSISGNPEIEITGTSPPDNSIDRTTHPNGTSGTWTLDTTGMVPCGYSAEIDVTDRTIVNSTHVGRRSHDAEGFCLLAPSAEDDSGSGGDGGDDSGDGGASGGGSDSDDSGSGDNGSEEEEEE